uniref:Uncharacterized protein n=1 Tax=Bos mutus grunniens TaxID=30521 RepID=A0A8B9YAU4_BOSMU
LRPLLSFYYYFFFFNVEKRSKFKNLECEKMGGAYKYQNTHGCVILPEEFKSQKKHCCIV